MTVHFNAATGQLGLDRIAFDALVALSSGDDAPEEALADARDAGVVNGTSIHPDVRARVAAATDPKAVARLEMHNEQGALVVGECWLGHHVAAYLLGPPCGPFELVETPLSFFPVSVSRLVGLSPRPRVRFQPWRMPIEMVADVFSHEAHVRRDTATTIANTTDDPDTRAFTDVLAQGPWWYWNLGVQWAGAHEDDGARSLHVADTRRGMALLSLSGEDRIAVDPTNPTEVFHLLTAILPRDHELAPD